MPTSSVAGLSFVLSANNNNNLSNVYTSWDDLEDALPKNIRFPVAIEIAVTGLQDTIRLKNIKIEKNGALEIINRQFGQAYYTSTVCVARSSASDREQRFVATACSIDLQNFLTDSSAVSVSDLVFEADRDWETVEV